MNQYLSRRASGDKLTMLSARVVLPEMAMLIPETQAQLLALPESLDFCAKIGPPPPAVLTDQPRRAKAAMTAAIDLMKNSHLIFRGWMRTRGSWTVVNNVSEKIGDDQSRLTGPEDKVRNHPITCNTGAGWQGIGVRLQ